MAAEKNRQEKDPHDTDFFDDLTERVFKNYEPPEPNDPADDTEEDEGAESQQAA